MRSLDPALSAIRIPDLESKIQIPDERAVYVVCGRAVCVVSLCGKGDSPWMSEFRGCLVSKRAAAYVHGVCKGSVRDGSALRSPELTCIVS